MGTESSSTQGAPNNISRRRVVAGAAWSVPAVMVASAAPAVAASKGPLSFTNCACKLPGYSQGIFKAYEFLLLAQNPVGLPGDSVLVVEAVSIGGNPVPPANFAIIAETPSEECACDCAIGDASDRVCIPEGAEDMRLLLLAGPWDDSANTSITLTYTLYTCGSCTPQENATSVTITSGELNTPPVQGAACDCL